MKGAMRGMGCEDYRILYEWFSQPSDLAMSSRVQKVMSPNAAKTESDIAAAVLAWEREIEDIVNINQECKLADVYKKGALRKILIGKLKDEVELKYATMSYQQMYDFVMSYAQMRRVESGGDKMDVGGIQRDNRQPQNDNQWHSYPGSSIDAVGKDKGKGKFGGAFGGKGMLSKGGTDSPK